MKNPFETIKVQIRYQIRYKYYLDLYKDLHILLMDNFHIIYKIEKFFYIQNQPLVKWYTLIVKYKKIKRFQESGRQLTFLKFLYFFLWAWKFNNSINCFSFSPNYSFLRTYAFDKLFLSFSHTIKHLLCFSYYLFTHKKASGIQIILV